MGIVWTVGFFLWVALLYVLCGWLLGRFTFLPPKATPKPLFPEAWRYHKYEWVIVLVLLMLLVLLPAIAHTALGDR